MPEKKAKKLLTRGRKAEKIFQKAKIYAYFLAGGSIVMTMTGVFISHTPFGIMKVLGYPEYSSTVLLLSVS